MRPMDSADVDHAVAEMVRVLTPHEFADWRRPAGTLDWSCWETAAHVAHDLLAYASQLAARPDSAYLPFDLVVRDDASPRDLLDSVTGAGRLLSAALAASDPSVRAWHWGPTDPSGFAALGVNETLMHTHDITEGLGIRWHPPESLQRRACPALSRCSGRGPGPGAPAVHGPYRPSRPFPTQLLGIEGCGRIRPLPDADRDLHLVGRQGEVIAGTCSPASTGNDNVLPAGGSGQVAKSV